VVGSGPFRFLADERIAGARVAYGRFEGYVPREDGVADWTAGPKVVHFDRVVWNVVPDPATAAAAMQRGEADWWEQPLFDLLPTLEKRRDLEVSLVEVTGNIGLMRFNALYPPFDNPAIRRALLPALDQTAFMQAVAGDRTEYWRDKVGYFAPGTPMASEAGMAALTGPRSTERAKQLLKEAGYKGERVVLLSPGDYPRIAALSLVAADMLQKCGMNVDVETIDWGGVIRRRASKAKPGEGGWSVFFTTFTGADMANPASDPALRGDGGTGWFGWPEAPKLEALRDRWLAASDDGQRKGIAADIQAQAFEDVPFLPLGQFFQPTVRSTRLKDGLTGMPLFWNIKPA
jgi:peptide/nickel transport system substrate-binding protein